MWVRSPSKKVSFCLIILARVAADTSPPNSFSPDDTQRFAQRLPGGQPVGFPPIAEETTTNAGERGATSDSACGALSARLFRTGAPDSPRDSQKTLNVIEKPACLRGKRIADRRLTWPWTWKNRGWHDPCTLRDAICCGETLDRLT